MKKVILVTIVLILSFVSNVTAQVPGDTLWTKCYGGLGSDKGAEVQLTSDGGYIITGRTGSFGAGARDAYLIKTDANGDTLWTKTYGGLDWDYAYSVKQTTDGGFIVVGGSKSFSSGGDYDVYLIKTDANGDTLWTRTYGGTDIEYGSSVQLTSDGGYVIIGVTKSFGAGDRDFYLLKTDANGDTLWTKTFGGTGSDEGYSVQLTSDGGYIIVGETCSYGVPTGTADVWLIKTDADGILLWSQTYGGVDTDFGNSIQLTSDDGYIVAGGTWSYGAGYTDAYLIKTDSNGDTLWTKAYGNTSYDTAYSIQQTDDDGYIFTGDYGYADNTCDVWIVKTDVSGNTIWEEMYGEAGGWNYDVGASIQITSDNNYIVVGQTYSYGAGDWDVYALKITGEGAQTLLPPTNVSVDPESWLLTWDAPEGATVFTDNFDSYTAGDYLCTQSTDWFTWGNTPGGTDDCYVVDVQSYSANNSIAITGASDIIHPFGDLTTGAWGVSFMMYIEPTYGGYFNLLHEFTEWRTVRTEWALEAYFGSTGSGFLHAGGSNAATFTHPVGGWFEIETIIDLDADWAEFYVDGVFVHAWQWSLQSSGGAGLLQLGAIDIYAAAPTGETPLFYIDDFAHTTVGTTTRNLIGYNVYLDGVLQTTTPLGIDVFEYQYTGLTIGQEYTAGVSAVYDEGESEIIEFPFIPVPPPVIPPENLTAEIVTFNDVLLNWDAPGGGGLYELIQHDGNPNNAYYQDYGYGYGVVYDVSGYTDVTLEMLDFRHSPWGVFGTWDYALHIVDWDTHTEVAVITGLQTTGDDIWEEGIDLGSVSETGLVGVFLEPMSNSPTDAYPCLDGDGVTDGASYYGDLVDYSAFALSGVGDFLMDLWIMAEEVDGFVQAKRFSTNLGSSIPRIATRTSIKLNSKVQHHNSERIFQTAATDDLRLLLGYNVYKDGVEIVYIPYPDILTYTDIGVEPGVREYYVTAVYDEGESDPSNAESVEIVLPIPQNVVATFNYPNVLVTWNPVSDSRDLVSYNVYRDGELTATGITSTMYVDPGLPAGVYIYNITAVYDGGWESDWSEGDEVIVTGTDNILIPVRTELTGNYPNPFNPETTIKFSLKEDSDVSVKIYNIKGAVVRTLVDGEMNAAYHEVIWDSKDNTGKQVGSGLYFYKMISEGNSGDYTSTKKMILLK